eukprot:3940932-Rhodomonas_salina.1
MASESLNAQRALALLPERLQAPAQRPPPHPRRHPPPVPQLPPRRRRHPLPLLRLHLLPHPHHRPRPLLCLPASVVRTRP